MGSWFPIQFNGHISSYIPSIHSVGSLLTLIKKVAVLALGYLLVKIADWCIGDAPRPSRPAPAPILDARVLDPKSHLALEESLRIGASLRISTDGMYSNDRITGELGIGSTKKAYQLESGKALLMPNLDTEPLYVWNKWEEIVQKEVEMSRFLTSIGILSPESEKVTIELQPSGLTVSGYLSKTFRQLGQENGCYIIESGNIAGDTWRKGTDFIFPSENDRLIAENWGPILKPLLSDIAKIIHYNIPMTVGSSNVAILKQQESGSDVFVVRYFGFDFYTKNCAHFNRILGPTAIDSECDPKQARDILKPLLYLIFSSEFGQEFEVGVYPHPSLSLRDQLIEDCVPQILEIRKQLARGP